MATKREREEKAVSGSFSHLKPSDTISSNEKIIEEAEEPDHEALQDILVSLLEELETRRSIEDRVPSLFILGPTGIGKTDVVEEFARNNNMKIKILQIGGLYSEIFGSFPVISRDKKEIEETIVKLEASDELPPRNSSSKWIVFFDNFNNFNKDSRKMAGVMNFLHILLSGSIGSTYNLPLKTIAIAAGNLGIDTDGVDVAKIDTAAYSRFSAVHKMDHDWGSWLKYAEKIRRKPDEREDGTKFSMGGFSDTILAWITEKKKKYADKGDYTTSNNFKIPYESVSTGEKNYVNPRNLVNIDERSKNRAIIDWEEDNLIGKKTKEDYQREYENRIRQNTIDKERVPSVESYYYQRNERSYVIRGIKAALGNYSGDVINDYLVNVEDIIRMFKEISSERIIFNWVTGKISKENGKMFINRFITSEEGARVILNIKSKDDLKKKIEKVARESGTLSETKKAMKEHRGDPVTFVAENIIRYFIDVGIDGESEYANAFLSDFVKTERWKKDQEKSGISIISDIINIITSEGMEDNPLPEAYEILMGDTSNPSEKD